MKKLLLPLLFLSTLLRADDPLLFHADAAALKEWRLTKTRAEAAEVADSAGRHIRYKLSPEAKPMDSYWTITQKVSLGSIPTGYSFTAKGGHPGLLVGVRFADASGEQFQYRVTTANWQDFQTTHGQLPLGPGLTSIWGGDGNKKVDLPVTAVTLEFRKFSQELEGEMVVSDFKLFGPPPQELLQPTGDAKIALARRAAPDIHKPGFETFDRSSPLPLNRATAAFAEGPPPKAGKDIAGTFYFNYDDRHLYIAADIRDAFLSVKKDNKPYLNDGIELFFDGRNDSLLHSSGPDDYQLVINPGSPPRLTIYRNPDSAWLMAATELVSETVPGGYLLKVKIPREALKGFDPGKQAAGFELVLCDSDSSAFRRLFWSGSKDEEAPLRWGLLAFDPVAPGLLEAAVASRRERLEALKPPRETAGKAHFGAPQILANRILTPKIEKFAKVEGVVDLLAEYLNPFDFDDVNLTLDITGPDGKTTRIDGFFHEEYSELEYGLKSTGRRDWRWRFTPTLPGEYRAVTRLADAKKHTAELPEIRFTAADSERPGFLRVSSYDPHYLRFDNGSFFFARGYANHLWNDKRIDYYYKHHFNQLAWAKCNYTSVNFEALSNCGFRLGEGSKINYSMLNAARIDHTLELAERRGIYLIPCLMQTHWGMTKHWKNNPFSVENGGPCRTPEEMFTQPEVLRNVYNRHRYTVARYGYSPNILGWELYNEVEYTDKYQKDQEGVFDYLTKLARYLRGIDPNKHLISTSCATGNRVQPSPDFDFTIIHCYGRDIADLFHNRMIPNLKYPKPVVGGEIGITHPQASEGEKLDPEGVSLHNSIYISLLAGAAGTNLHWWNQYMEQVDRYEHFRYFADFTGGIEFDKEKVQPSQLTVDFPAGTAVIREQKLPAELKWPDAGRYPFHLIRDRRIWKEVGSDSFKEEIDGDTEHIAVTETIPGLIFGKARPELPGKLEIRLAARSSGTLRLRPGAVGTQGARLELHLDGKPALSAELKDHDGQNNPAADEKFDLLTLPIPRGNHTLTIINQGKDWFSIADLTLDNLDPAATNPGVRVYALTGNRTSILWVQNIRSTWYYSSVGEQPEIIRANTVDFPVRQDGKFRVRFFDTWRGTFSSPQTITSKNGLLHLTLPDFTRDIAIRVEAL